MTWSWELSSPCDSPSKFRCKHMPPNFGIKETLFHNYHVYVPDRSAIMGKESWSGVYCLSPPMSAHENASKTFMEPHGSLDLSSRVGYKMPIWLLREQLNNSAMLCFHLLSRVPLVSLDPPWSALLLWRSWAARRILVHRVIALLIQGLVDQED